MERFTNFGFSFWLVLRLVIAIVVIGFFAGMIALIALGYAPLGITDLQDLWVLVALILAALAMTLNLSGKVRLIATVAALVWLGSMAVLVVRGYAPLGVTDLADLWPLVILGLGTAGAASNMSTGRRIVRRRR